MRRTRIDGSGLNRRSTARLNPRGRGGVTPAERNGTPALDSSSDSHMMAIWRLPRSGRPSDGGVHMPDLMIRMRGGERTTLAMGELDRFASTLRGDLVLRDTPPYEDARRIWNRMVERRPALIARCRSAGDVVRAIRFSREHDLLISMRCGGHDIAGNALADEGLTIDLGPMRATRVEPVRRIVRTEAGITPGG